MHITYMFSYIKVYESEKPDTDAQIQWQPRKSEYERKGNAAQRIHNRSIKFP